ARRRRHLPLEPDPPRLALRLHRDGEGLPELALSQELLRAFEELLGGPGVAALPPRLVDRVLEALHCPRDVLLRLRRELRDRLVRELQGFVEPARLGGTLRLLEEPLRGGRVDGRRLTLRARFPRP